MLITEKGCCGRLSSVVTNVKIDPCERPAEEFCLLLRGIECKICIEKCIYNSLKLEELNKAKCYEIYKKNAVKHSNLGSPEVCGKCICVTPCSFEVPS